MMVEFQSLWLKGVWSVEMTTNYRQLVCKGVLSVQRR